MNEIGTTDELSDYGIPLFVRPEKSNGNFFISFGGKILIKIKMITKMQTNLI